jgi:hypothetical protein
MLTQRSRKEQKEADNCIDLPGCSNYLVFMLFCFPWKCSYVVGCLCYQTLHIAIILGMENTGVKAKNHYLFTFCRLWIWFCLFCLRISILPDKLYFVVLVVFNIVRAFIEISLIMVISIVFYFEPLNP